MIVQLIVEEGGQKKPLNFEYVKVFNAGYVGRNQHEVQKHIQELAQKGIPGPKTFPTLYPVSCSGLTTASEIEVYESKTSGEIEFVLFIEEKNKIYVGIGSDHTDRYLEETDIPRSKQICPNVVSSTVWPLVEIQNHWDDLIIKSTVIKDGEEILYQMAKLDCIFSPAQLMEFVTSKIQATLDRTIIFSGTVGMKTEDFVFAEQFKAELIDPHQNQKLESVYDIHVLSPIQP